MERLTRSFVLFVLATAICACTPTRVPLTSRSTPSAIVTPSVPHALEQGDDVARHLQARYDDPRQDCGSRSAPAFVCSGVLLRSTQYSDTYYSWRPNPATAPWGVNMSWLRADANFMDSFPTANGFVVYPEQQASGKGLAVLEIRCVYPNDSWSAGPDRCHWHEIKGKRSRTELCHAYTPAILTAQAWIKAGYGDDDNQCAFATDADYAGRADAWHQMIEVRRLDKLHWRNELVVASWVGLDDTRMPIEAFFYRPASASETSDPLANARNDQRDFMKLTARWVPIIRWDPTDAVHGGARFSYRAADQLIPAPARP